MDTVPIYLLAYFLKIRKHSGEVGYLERRFERYDATRAADEETMLRELVDLHLVGVSVDDVDVVIDPVVRHEGGRVSVRKGTQLTIRVPACFVVLARGRYIWTEILAKFVGWLLTAIVCGFAGGLAFDTQGDHFDAWVVAIVFCLALACLACVGLVATSPKAKR